MEEELSDEEKVSQFMAFTGSELQEAHTYLEFGGGNVETAVELYMASQERPAAREVLPTVDSGTFPSGNGGGFDIVRAPIAPKRELLADFGGMRGRGDEVFLRHHDHYEPPQSHRSSIPVAPGGAGGRSSNANSGYETLFQPPFDLMFTGSFEHAKREASSRSVWVMVTIHVDKNFACLVLNRDLWTDSTVKKVIKQHFVFIQYDEFSPEAAEHLNLYPIEPSDFPYVAILDPLTGERVKVWHSPLELPDFLIEVETFLSSREPKPVQTTTKKDKKDLARMTEEEQLELAIKASIKEGNSLTQADDEDGSEEEMEGEVAEVLTDLASIFKSIPPTSEAEPSENYTLLQIKFPSGERLVRKFRKDDKISSIFGFVKGKQADTATPEMPFDLFDVKSGPLLLQFSKTLEEANVIGAALKLDYITV